MLSSLLRGDFDIYSVIQVLLSIPIILLALSLHESAHGYVAKLMGDRTAYNLGRITLNPVKHLDFMGTLMMFVFGFGWAKPVPINTRYFKNPKWGMALSALAGPVSNIIASYIFYFLASLLALKITTYNVFILAVYLFCMVGFQLNLHLAIFNFLPIPPLDGSRILFTFLPAKAYFGVMKYERYISLAIMILLFTGLLSAPLSYVADLVWGLFELSVGWMR